MLLPPYFSFQSMKFFQLLRNLFMDAILYDFWYIKTNFNTHFNLILNFYRFQSISCSQLFITHLATSVFFIITTSLGHSVLSFPFFQTSVYHAYILFARSAFCTSPLANLGTVSTTQLTNLFLLPVLPILIFLYVLTITVQ